MAKFFLQGRLTYTLFLVAAMILCLCPLSICRDAQASVDYPRSIEPVSPVPPPPHYIIAAMFAEARVGKKDLLYDLGCSGDGRIVIEAVKQTRCRAVCIGINEELVNSGRKAAHQAGLKNDIQFIVADIFKEDISKATVVMLSMGNRANIQLRPKLLRELKPGTRIAAYIYDMGDWKPDIVSIFDKEKAYFWITPVNASGRWIGIDGKGRSRSQWVLELRQVFQEISGEVSYLGKRYPIIEGTILGEEIRFKTDGEPFGQGAIVEFKGRIIGHSLKGTIGNETSRRPWNAIRSPVTMQSIDREKSEHH